MNRTLTVGFIGLLALGAQAAGAQNVGYFSSGNSAGMSSVINTAGFTPVAITNFSTFNFSTVDILFLDDPFNSGPFAPRVGDLATWISGGGRVAYFDWEHNNAIMPGMSGVTYPAGVTCQSNIDPLGSNAITSGPNGTIGASTLDGGNCSAHGGMALASLPTGSVAFLDEGGNPNLVSAFSYAYGSGRVFYSDTPITCYTNNGCVDPPRTSMNNIYAPNVLDYLNDSTSTPEPATLTLMGTGLIAIIGANIRRRRRAA